MKSLYLLVGFFILTITHHQTIAQERIDDKKSSIKFSIQHGKDPDVDGTLGGLTGSITFDEKELARSSIKASVAVKTIDTGVSERDEHLLQGDFFDEDSFPEISFESRTIKRSGDGFVAEGLFTMRGKSQRMSVPFTYSRGRDQRAVFTGKLVIPRLDFGVGNSGDELGKDVKVNFTIVTAPK